MEEYLTRGEKEFLLKIARSTLELKLLQGEKFEPQTVNQKLWEKYGVFVTLRKGRELRGCIGYVEPTESVILAVRDNALKAMRDPRLDPVEASELPKIKIEISILTRPQKTEFEEIKKGDGVVLKNGEKNATYLPQAWEEVFSQEEFFTSLCQKAGLPGNCYLDPKTEFFKYEAMVFKEGEI
ncbi:MAG: AmmeMemoRadiSam system protein A [Patescibacteria group bacterium]